MARIIYSALVDSIRGSIQGTTFQRNAYGYTIKGKPNMVNPNSISQNRRKSTFSGAIQAWRNLSDANRAAWDAYATNFPIPSRKNPNAYLSGLAAFNRWHALRWTTNSIVLADPSGAQGTVTVNSIELIIFAGELVILVDAVYTQGPWRVYVSLTRPLSTTQNFLKGWTRIIADLSEAEAVEMNIDASYVNTFGQRPVIGDRVGVRLSFLNTTNGQIFFEASQIITVTV